MVQNAGWGLTHRRVRNHAQRSMAGQRTVYQRVRVALSSAGVSGTNHAAAQLSVHYQDSMPSAHGL